MSVLINFKICDNAKECGGVAVCPVGALSWDEGSNSISIDNDKCISCGLCEKECPIGAIRVAKNNDDYDRIKKEIADDKRSIKDLFVDRYGAVAISDFFKLDFSSIQSKINNDNVTLIEVFNPDEAACLLKSIPIKDLTNKLGMDTLYYKCEVDSNFDKYDCSCLPALLVFRSSKLLGKIEGYYTTDEIDVVMSLLDDILEG